MSVGLLSDNLRLYGIVFALFEYAVRHDALLQ
jgi:hypothetical protein